MRTAKDWGLTGDSALIFDMLADWKPCDVETLPMEHTRGIDEGGKQFTITPKPLIEGCDIPNRGYVVTGNDGKVEQSPILEPFTVATWVSHLKLRS